MNMKKLLLVLITTFFTVLAALYSSWLDIEESDYILEKTLAISQPFNDRIDIDFLRKLRKSKLNTDSPFESVDVSVE